MKRLQKERSVFRVDLERGRGFGFSGEMGQLQL